MGVVMRYVMLIDGKPGQYGAAIPDLPGCTTMAESIDALLDRAPEVIAFHLEGLIEDGDAVPQPRSVDALRADPGLAEDFAHALLVSVVDVRLPVANPA
jgi:predicted RNase H-like HicB family nuclease